MGDGFDFDVWYKGMIIGNVKAMTLRKASNLAKRIYGDEVTVTSVN